MTRILAATAAILAALLLGPRASAVTPQLVQATVAGEWAATQPCGSSSSRLRFAGGTLAFFSGMQPISEYEVSVTQAGDRITVRILRVLHQPSGRGGLPAGGALQYRREGEALRLIGVARQGDAFSGPTVATLYRRCQ